MIKFIPGYHPSFKSQFDKLTSAYISNKVNRCDGCACFVGNLLNGKSDWFNGNICFDVNIQLGQKGYPTAKELAQSKPPSLSCQRIINSEANGLYTPAEIYELEGIFMTYSQPTLGDSDSDLESLLFIAFEKTLDLLKEIHESKGEIVDETPVFIKRPQPVN